MVGNGVSFNPRPILNLNYLLLSIASTEESFMHLVPINPYCDPKFSSLQRLIIKSSVQTIICPEQVAHFLCWEWKNVTLFFKSSACCGPPFIFDLWPPRWSMIANPTCLLEYFLEGGGELRGDFFVSVLTCLFSFHIPLRLWFSQNKWDTS